MRSSSFFKWINILNEYERGVIFRLGRVLKEPKGPGFVFVFWPIDRMVKMSLRTVVHDIPPQDVITRDNVSVKVNAVVYFRVMNPVRAVVEVENYVYATSQLAQTTLRAVLGEVELDDLLTKREQLNVRLQSMIDEASDPWGVKVSMVEVKHVDLPPDMQRAIAKQAEAEREKRAKIIHAEGELTASVKLAEAAEVMSKNPCHDPVALHADPCRDFDRERLDHRLPDADQIPRRLDEARGQRRVTIDGVEDGRPIAADDRMRETEGFYESQLLRHRTERALVDRAPDRAGAGHDHRVSRSATGPPGRC